MSIDAISLPQLVPQTSSLTQHKLAGLSGDKQDESVAFETVLNSILSKELMKPLFASTLFSGSEQYTYILENALGDYFQQHYPLLSLNGEQHDQ